MWEGAAPPSSGKMPGCGDFSAGAVSADFSGCAKVGRLPPIRLAPVGGFPVPVAIRGCAGGPPGGT
jgi:hypothetical protein